MIRLALMFAATFASCSHPPTNSVVTPGQVYVVGDITLTTREHNAVDVTVIRTFRDHHATGTATLRSMSVDDAMGSRLVNVAKGRAWLAIAGELTEAPAAYDAALRGLEELGTDYRSAKGKGKHIIDDSGQSLRLAKISADKGDHAVAAAEVMNVLRERIRIYVRVSDGAVE
jgi:hypothetical protein